jgi:hypothetical protein
LKPGRPVRAPGRPGTLPRLVKLGTLATAPGAIDPVAGAARIERAPPRGQDAAILAGLAGERRSGGGHDRGTKGGGPRAIQRTALAPDGEKIGRMTLGPKTGAAIKLTADEDVADYLLIGEGSPRL